MTACEDHIMHAIACCLATCGKLSMSASRTNLAQVECQHSIPRSCKQQVLLSWVEGNRCTCALLAAPHTVKQLLAAQVVQAQLSVLQQYSYELQKTQGHIEFTRSVLLIWTQRELPCPAQQLLAAQGLHTQLPSKPHTIAEWCWLASTVKMACTHVPLHL